MASSSAGGERRVVGGAVWGRFAGLERPEDSHRGLGVLGTAGPALAGEGTEDATEGNSWRGIKTGVGALESSGFRAGRSEKIKT